MPMEMIGLDGGNEKESISPWSLVAIIKELITLYIPGSGLKDYETLD